MRLTATDPQTKQETVRYVGRYDADFFPQCVNITDPALLCRPCRLITLLFSRFF